MTPADIRHHLAALEAEGAVRRLEAGPGSGEQRGRPAARFTLAAQAQAHNLDRLAAALLAELLAQIPPTDWPDRLASLAERLKQNGESALGTGDQPSGISDRQLTTGDQRPTTGNQRPGGSLSHRLVTAVQVLNQMNYLARWEAHAAAPRVIFGRCPYADILPEHPELCQLDVALLENLLGSAVRQTARLEPAPNGAPQCVFRIESRGA